MASKHTSGTSAPSIGFPAPSKTRYVGICNPSFVTELKKSGLGIIGDWDAGSSP
jgi:hypothetical protein